MGILFLASCSTSEKSPTGPSNPDTQFASLSEEFLRGYLAWRPQVGTQLGLHEYDGRLTDYSKASRDAELKRLKQFDGKLKAMDFRKLGSRAAYDYRLLRAEIDRDLFGFEDQQGFTKNPMTYAEAADVAIYIKRNFAPLENRVKSIIAIENQVPRLLQTARENLEPELAKPFIETAIDETKGVIDFLGKDLPDAVKDLHNEALKTGLDAANKRAIAEFRSYSEWLQKEKLPRAHNHYALGREKYQRMIRGGELIELSPEAILELGLKELKREQAVFAETARKIDPSKPAIEVFKEIQKDHPTAQSLIPDARKTLESIRQFCIDHKIVTFPSEVRARVEETPSYLRATSFASMDTPGPFETKATEAYYYVTPTEEDWSAKQKEEWLTAFNYYTTDVVSIHEAYPGHYTQFLCLNASPANRLEKILSSYAFVEGWAHYCEKMLLDEGFGKSSSANPGSDEAVRAAKYRLAQSDEALLRLCRLCVSIKTHCQAMPMEDAIKFFEDNCYYEPKPARQEAMRGAYDPQYLYYTVGKLQILKLRRDIQAEQGASFSLQRFHDDLLRHGMPPVRLLREIMLKDNAKWAQDL